MTMIGEFLTIAAASQPTGGGLGFFLPFILMLVFFYIILYIPEKKRKKKYKGMLDSLKVNDEIITKGGILGKVINVQDTFIILETGPSRARIKLDKNGILSILNPSNVEEKEDKKEVKKENKHKEEIKEETKEETKKEVKEEVKKADEESKGVDFKEN
ncbi:preprotein translocase subunit YajC [Clostridium liquoris]|mgnify:CR=1 FL=1|jgi:preprotein translocase subunit YajC|uniref:Preprotein translocase subunit YajC n=1 Tax=Clostridium liquoris TaxID=1289519 RepID=A0A2T0B003_9CLOT|nr:preprotein translocase subunit YajC [Clostridium liquoris]